MGVSRGGLTARVDHAPPLPGKFKWIPCGDRRATNHLGSRPSHSPLTALVLLAMIPPLDSDLISEHNVRQSFSHHLFKGDRYEALIRHCCDGFRCLVRGLHGLGQPSAVAKA